MALAQAGETLALRTVNSEAVSNLPAETLNETRDWVDLFRSLQQQIFGGSSAVSESSATAATARVSG